MAAHSFWGFDFGDEYIVGVHYVPQERAVTNLMVVPVADSFSDRWKNVQAALDGEVKPKIDVRGLESVVGLPAEDAVIKQIELDADEVDIQKVLQWELSQQMLDSLDDYDFDFQRLNDANGNETSTARYLTVLYPKTLVDSLKGFLKTNRFKPVVIDLDLFALINAFEANYPDEAKSGAMLVSASSRGIRVVLTRNGEFVDLETSDEDCGDCSLDDIMNRIRTCTDRLNDNVSPSSMESQSKLPVFLSGSLFMREELRDALIQGLDNARPFLPFSTISCSLGEAIEQYYPVLSVALGLALRGAPVE